MFCFLLPRSPRCARNRTNGGSQQWNARGNSAAGAAAARAAPRRGPCDACRTCRRRPRINRRAIAPLCRPPSLQKTKRNETKQTPSCFWTFPCTCLLSRACLGKTIIVFFRKFKTYASQVQKSEIGVFPPPHRPQAPPEKTLLLVFGVFPYMFAVRSLSW